MQELQFRLRHLTIKGLGFGQAHKPIILALHGWLDNAASFIPLSRYLDTHYLVAIDLPGHGLSDHRSPDAHYHLLDFVQDLHELISDNNWSDIILLGHSMGGIIATLYAASFAENVRKLVSIESFGPYCQSVSSSAQQLRESVLSRIKQSGTPARQPLSVDRAVAARVLAGDLDPTSAALLVQRNLSHQPQGQLSWRTDRRLRTLSSLRLTDAQAEAFMRQVRCPTLFIKGTTGFQAVAKALQVRHSWLADLHVKEVLGGHHVHMQCAEHVAQVINEFIK